MGESLDDAWSEVRQRDWVADPISAVFEVVYISSVMTGIVNYNAERFAAVREDLRSTGRYAVLCPSQRGERDLDKPRSHHMRRDFQDVLNSKGVFVFDEWWRSPGSRAEVVVALEIGHWVHVYDPLAEDRKGPEVTMDDYRKFWAEAINA
jgi:hypothetical protein